MKIPNAEKQLPFISVVICTYNRKRLLKDCLESVFAMQYPESRTELIVVDGGSNDGTAELCKEFPKIRFVIEKKRGLATARNIGANLARGSIVAYTDDDCVVDKYWLMNLARGFRVSESFVGVGGPVCPLHPDIIPDKILVKPALGLFDEGNSSKLVNGIITSNCAFKKNVFKMAKFDEELGVTRRGKLILMGEDVDFCNRLVDLGCKLLYTPNARVYHQVFNERVRVKYVIKHAMHNGLSTSVFLMRKTKSRIWTVRMTLSALVQGFFGLTVDRSFTSCYKIVRSFSALIASVTSMDRIIQAH